MEFIDIELVILQQEMDLLWIIENQRSENPQNEHLRGNLHIDWSNEIQILKSIYQSKFKN